MTENERIWQWLDAHWDQFLEYWQTKTKDLSRTDIVAFDADRIAGIMADWVYQGVRKVVMVTPQSLVEGLTRLDEEVRSRCEAAAAAAENAAGYANTEGSYAKSQGDRVAELILDITDLKLRVKLQGDTAEQQGNAAQAQKETVEAWFTPFKSGAESWFSGIVSDVTGWFAATKEDWNSWFAARKLEWTSWFPDVSSEWTTWFAARKLEWTSWFSDVSSGWTTWFAATMENWNTWFAAAREAVTLWASKEQERQSAEEIRLEMMAHPPIPSERGYWMFWDMTVTPHAYVESGYSSRGTMDWPEFFWDYSCMGIGVITTRDYTRFSIDEQGRFKMKM